MKDQDVISINTSLNCHPTERTDELQLHSLPILYKNNDTSTCMGDLQTIRYNGQDIIFRFRSYSHAPTTLQQYSPLPVCSGATVIFSNTDRTETYSIVLTTPTEASQLMSFFTAHIPTQKLTIKCSSPYQATRKSIHSHHPSIHATRPSSITHNETIHPSTQRDHPTHTIHHTMEEDRQALKGDGPPPSHNRVKNELLG